MQHAQVIEEDHIAWLELNLESSSFREHVQGIEGLSLSFSQVG